MQSSVLCCLTHLERRDDWSDWSSQLLRATETKRGAVQHVIFDRIEPFTTTIKNTISDKKIKNVTKNKTKRTRTSAQPTERRSGQSKNVKNKKVLYYNMVSCPLFVSLS